MPHPRLSFAVLDAHYPTTSLPCTDRHWEDASRLAYENQCAIRLSIALRRCGFDLSAYDRRNKCSHGNARGAEQLAAFLKKRLESEWLVPASARRRMAGRSGIVFFRNLGGGTGDHLDLWNGTRVKKLDCFDRCAQVLFFPLGST